LKNECGYKGYQPYWDWSLDTPDEGGSWAGSPIWDTETGFGGNGINGTIVNITPFMEGSPVGGVGKPVGSCVVTGPFAQDKYTLNLDSGPPTNFTTLPTAKRCLFRNWQPQITDIGFGWDKNVKPVLELFPFANFTAALDKDIGDTGAPGLHPNGHGGTGGEVRYIRLRTEEMSNFKNRC
jgi:tyrosinase